MDIITVTEVLDSIANQALRSVLEAEENVQGYIDSREKWVEEQLTGTLTFPLTEVPETLKIALIDIVAFDCYKKNDATDVPNTVRDAYKEALKAINNIKSNNTIIDPEQQPDTSIQFTVATKFFTEPL